MSVGPLPAGHDRTTANAGSIDGVAQYERYCRPGLMERLRAFNLDAHYTRAAGDYLQRALGNHEVKVLDLIGGYGAGLFGHNHPVLTEYAMTLLSEGVPFNAQASCRASAGRLAEALTARVGDYIVVFTNSGAETIEAALRHLALEQRGRRYWAVHGAFHGKTAGAGQLSHGGAAALGDGAVRFLDPEDPADWEAALAEDGRDLGAAFVEPILGEGGVRPLAQPFLEWLSGTCAALGAALVVDEVQTGMGRTGSFLESWTRGLDPDYVCLSKSLGGGLAKIGALLIRRSRFVHEFALTQASTFAEDDWSCLIALRALGLLDEDGLTNRCSSVGRSFTAELDDLRVRHPSCVADVRGRGLMIGVELADHGHSSSNVLRIGSSNGLLGWMVAAYLLNVHRIRIAPTLSDPSTLRIEPSAYFPSAEVAAATEALEDVIQVLEAGDAARLTAPLLGLPLPPLSRRPRPARAHVDASEETPWRVAFLGHLLEPEDLVLIDDSLAGLPTSSLEGLLERFARTADAGLIEQRLLQSPTGRGVHLSFIGLNITARQIARARDEGDVGWVIEKIHRAAELASASGCQTLGLGGFTSSLTGAGLRLPAHGLVITTGNALTVGMAMRALKLEAARRDVDLGDAPVGIVGAPGSIAAASAQLLAEHARELILVVRRPSARASGLAERIRAASPETLVRVTTDLRALRTCSCVLSSSSAGRPIITEQHLGPATVVVCDIAVPGDVAAEVRQRRPDVSVIDGGIVRLPDPDFTLSGIRLEPGCAFACLAETLLLGLERQTTNGYRGTVTAEAVRQILSFADAHDFGLAVPGRHLKTVG